MVKDRIVSYTGFYYESGIGGVPLYADDFVAIEEAHIVSIEGQVAGSSEVKGQIGTAVGVELGTLVYNSGTVAPVTNEFQLFLYNTEYGTTASAIVGTVAELVSGTVKQTVNVYVRGS